MRAELRASIPAGVLAGVLSCTVLISGCGKSGSQQAGQGQASAAAANPERQAAAQRIAERIAAYDAWVQEGSDAVKAQDQARQQKMPQFDDLKADALKVIEIDPADEAALQAIRVILSTNELEYDPKTGSYPSEGPAVETETRMTALLVEHHVNHPGILAVKPKLDGLSRLDYWQQVYETTRNPDVRGNFAALLAGYYFSEQNKPSLSEEQRTAFREQGMQFVETIRNEFAAVVPGAIVSVPTYLQPEGKVSSYRGPDTPTLAKLMDDRVRLLDQSVGNALPNIQLVTVTGKPDALENYRGKVVILDMWATNCDPCRAAIPELTQLKQELQGQPFEIISVSADDNLPALKAFLLKEKLPWVQWHAGSAHEVMERLGVPSATDPMYLVVDARGVVRERTTHLSDNSKAAIRDLVEKASRI